MNTHSFKKNLFILILIGILAYILDLSTSNNLYHKCMTIQTQSLLLIHHIIYIFSLFAWLSNNLYILVLNVILIIGMFIHWKINNNICTWTQTIKEKCNIKENLRTFIKLLFPEYRDKERIKQKIYLSIVLIISIIKIFIYF